MGSTREQPVGEGSVAAGVPDGVPAAVAAVDAERPEPGASAREQELLRLIGERERLLAEREQVLRVAVRERELATALAGRPLVPGAAAQLLKLWADEFDVVEDGGRYRVASRDGRPASAAVADWLARPEYAHFCPPSSRGGAAAPGAARPPSSEPAGPPGTLGEALVRRWREANGAAPEGRPIGLRRR
jgi:hypothetical protein